MVRAADFAELDAAAAARWRNYGQTDDVVFPVLLGLRVEEVRADYCRMRLPFRSELRQGGGVLHGGAVAALLDSVLVPAIGGTLAPGTLFATVDLHVQYLRPIVDDDVVAEGWVVQRGRRTVFGRSEASAATSGELVATAVLTYNVSAPR
jgi:uncharacterized protein (TIGR00369 family)